MSIKEQLTQAKSELAGLKTRVKAGEDEAISRAKELMDEVIPALEEQVKKATEANELLAKMGSTDDKPADDEKPAGEDEPKSMGDLAVKTFVGKGLKSKGHFTVTSQKASSDLHRTPTITVTDNKLIYGTPELTVRDLFAQERISGNSLTYFVGQAMEGALSSVAEGQQKPQVHFPYEEKTVALKKLAGYIKESDEILEDAKWMADAIENRLLIQLKLLEEAQLINGNGTGANVTGLLNVSGTGAITGTGAISADDLFKAITKIKSDSYFNADSIVLNPVDYQTLRLAKDANDQYYGGGYFYAPYGNGQIGNAGLWGLNTVTSASLPVGTAIVGAFKQGASVITNGDVRLEATNSDTDDFTNNRVTVRAEERLALAVRVPAAFVVVKSGE